MDIVFSKESAIHLKFDCRQQKLSTLIIPLKMIG